MENKQELEALKDIKQMMERSSRFLSLSGWSGIAAGICALIGSYFLMDLFNKTESYNTAFTIHLFIIFGLTFLGALITAFFFTYKRTCKANVSIWGASSRNLFLSVGIPFVAGALLVAKMILLRYMPLVPSACLIVYGIALFSGSKQTISEIKYLAYSEMILGVISFFFLDYGLIFWALGFGVLHILYGIIMWLKYEKGGEQ